VRVILHSFEYIHKLGLHMKVSVKGRSEESCISD
jgi:hypothetical protein